MRAAKAGTVVLCLLLVAAIAAYSERSYSVEPTPLPDASPLGTVQTPTPTPETITAELWLAYAAGLHGVIHWEFQGWRSGTFELGEFGLRAPADGGATPRSEAVEEFARTFARNRELLLPAERPPPAQK